MVYHFRFGLLCRYRLNDILCGHNISDRCGHHFGSIVRNRLDLRSVRYHLSIDG